MNRKIPNKPHPTPNPDKPHTGAGADRGNMAWSLSNPHGTPAQASPPGGEPTAEEPTYDSCFDDLNLVLSQSMQQPDPDPNLKAAGELTPGHDAIGAESVPRPRGTAPRTSEIFRSVVATGGDSPPASDTALPTGLEEGPSGELAIPGLSVVDRRAPGRSGEHRAERPDDGRFPWAHIVLLSYSSALTLALIWMFWTGRIPKAPDPNPEPAAAEKPALESPARAADPAPSSPSPPLPPGNLTTLRQAIRLGDLEVTPLSVLAVPVELVREIDPDKRRRERDCLILRLRLLNRSTDQTFSPVDRILVRDRDLRVFDPYIATSEGRKIRLFPLAMDSEWSILGQSFPTLRPGESAETFVAAEPGSAKHLADEMTWRVRFWTGVYRSDMLGVRFTRADVRRPRTTPWEDEDADG